MKSKVICPELFALLAVALVLSLFTALERQQQRISDSMLRLHVVANSDTELDQAIKLQVRDAVLSAAEPILSGANSAEDAKVMLSDNLFLLEDAANETLQALGSGDTALVSLQRELFDARHYDTFSLPGGYYDALRVTIGSGEGHNWWCVVYPQICTAATTEDQRAVAVMAGISQEDYDTLAQDTEEYEFKFKILELFEAMMETIRPALESF